MGSSTAGRTRGRQPKALVNDPTLESPLYTPRMEERLATEVGPLKDQKRSLTSREWKFVQELVAGEGHVTPKEAALRAGYAVNVAVRVANTLTNPAKNPHVVAAIKEFRREVAEKYGTNYERHMRDLMIIRDKALEAGNYGAAVTAEYRRGQALGSIYVDRKEIRHGTIDSMSKDEVMRKLEEIKKIYGGSQGTIEDIDSRTVDNDTGSEALPEDQAEFDASDPDADRVEGKSGDPRPFGSFKFEVPADRVEGSEQGTEGKPVPPSD